jgi:ADP-ribosylglycohydrolase
LHFEDFIQLPQTNIKSSGYVVDTLEASLWCLANTKSYREAVLAAVNLGNDTDTTAAITGSLAGLAYGLEDIPAEWRASLLRRNYIETLCQKLIP